MTYKLHFLSGLPRTGSTLLASLLNQDPKIYATGTSPLSDLMYLLNLDFLNLKKIYNFETDNIELDVYRGVLLTFHKHKNKKVIFDKHRAWPKNLDPLKLFISNPKIVVTVRPVPEIITSYITLIERSVLNNKENFIDRDLKLKGLPLSLENRAKLVWEKYVKEPYESVLLGLHNDREKLLFIEYGDIVSTPLSVLSKVYEFFELEEFKAFDTENIVNKEVEKDEEAWGMPDLHNIRPVLKSVSKDPKEVLGTELFYYFNKFNINYD